MNRGDTPGSTDARGVTPLVAVVLMLALTVTMVAIAVPFVFTSTNQVGNSQPDTEFAFAYSEDVDFDEKDSLEVKGSSVGADGLITVVVESGESVPAGQLNLSGTLSEGNLGDGEFDEDEDVLIGAEITVWAQRGDRLQVVWSAENEDESAILADFTVYPEE